MSDQPRLPAPVGPPRSTRPSQRPRDRHLVVIIVAPAVTFVLLIGLVAWGAASLAHRVAETHRSPTPGAGLGENTGPRVGTRHATDPLDCSDVCITSETAASGIRLMPDELRAVGAPTRPEDDFDTGPSTPQADYDETKSEWEDDQPSGDPCMFTYAYVPLRDTKEVPPDDDQSVTRYLAQYEDDDDATTVTLGARAFVDSSQAVAYAGALEDAIAHCRHYSTDGSDAQVDAIESWPELPSDITAVGWAERGDGYAYYGVDLQRGDLVVRTSVAPAHALATSALQQLVAAVADRLERLPADGSRPPNA